MNNNIVIGIEGYVGAGKTSICRELLNIIPNSIILHGGNLYRAIVYAIINSKIDLNALKNNLSSIDIKDVMDKLKIEIKLNKRETEVYINGVLANEEELQSKKSSMAVSIVGTSADNTKLYSFAKKLIDNYKQEYNVIVSGRDLINIYPNLDYHFLITASIDERVKRKAIQYDEKVDLEELKEHIIKRDELQEKAGYYKIYNNTIVVDVTNTKTVEESTAKLLEYIKIPQML